MEIETHFVSRESIEKTLGGLHYFNLILTAYLVFHSVLLCTVNVALARAQLQSIRRISTVC